MRLKCSPEGCVVRAKRNWLPLIKILRALKGLGGNPTQDCAAQYFGAGDSLLFRAAAENRSRAAERVSAAFTDRTQQGNQRFAVFRVVVSKFDLSAILPV